MPKGIITKNRKKHSVRTQEIRERAVAVKLNPLKANVKNRRVILIDDSIVR